MSTWCPFWTYVVHNYTNKFISSYFLIDLFCILKFKGAKFIYNLTFVMEIKSVTKKIISFIRWYLYLHHTEILFAYLYYQWVSCKEEKIRNKCNWHIPPDLYIFHEMGFSGYWGQLVSLFLPANLLLLYCVLVIRRERIL